MVKRKKLSKRLTLRKKHKILKKVTDHHRKIRKENKNDRKKKFKNPGVPNSFPFKEQIIDEEMNQKKQEKGPEKFKLIEKKMPKIQSLLIYKHGQETTSFDINDEENINKYLNSIKPKDFSDERFNNDNSLKSYGHELKKVIEQSDILVEVLDVRDPAGSRCPDLEKEVISQNKKLILLLNKIDLVPKEATISWLKHLRHEHPTIAFKSGAQNSKKLYGQINIPSLKDLDKRALKSNKCIGAKSFISLINSYCDRKGIKSTVVVGIVGIPNVGKSSVINSLKKEKACPVGSIPGITKKSKEIYIQSNIKLLDCPGVIFKDGISTDVSRIMKNCVKTMDDPICSVDEILKFLPKEQLMKLYDIGNFDDTDSFLNLFAKRFCKYSKGGVPNQYQAAKSFIQDWNNGKIKYYTLPPTTNKYDISSNVVPYWKSEFDLNVIDKNDDEDIKDLIESMPSLFDASLPKLPSNDCKESLIEDENDEMEVEHSESKKVFLTQTFKKKLNQFRKENLTAPGMAHRRKDYMLMKKKAKKFNKRLDNITNKFSSIECNMEE